MSSELTQGQNVGRLIKPRGLNQGTARPLDGNRDGASIDSRRDARNFLRDDYDEEHLTAADDFHRRAPGRRVWGRFNRKMGSFRCGAVSRWQRTWRTDGSGLFRFGPVESDFLNRRIQYKESINAAENL